MQDLKDFVRALCNRLPANLGGVKADGISPVQPDDLDEPKRVRFEFSRQAGRSGLLEALAGYFGNLDDVANLRDLEAFPELHLGVQEQPQLSYFS